MYYVYVIESINSPEHHYVGQTSDLKSRLAAHNAGQSIHTSRHKPWNLICYLGFANKPKALAFEKIPQIRLREDIS